MEEDIFLKRYPRIDFHGYDRECARVSMNDFILENYLLGNETVIIIHGKGMGIIRKTIHEELGKNKYVLEYKVDNFNDGVTIVKLKKHS